MQAFLNELLATLHRHTNLSADTSFLDMGCGRGYFLEFLRRKDFPNLQGADPCRPLIEDALFEGTVEGSFEKHPFAPETADIVMACHTLHHLHDPHPLYAIEEMARLSRRYVVIAEINNTNLPMLLVSTLNKKVEANAYRYNQSHVMKLLRAAGLNIVYQGNMASGYISGNSWLHKLSMHAGTRPYNLLIAEKPTP